jgi:hypothetical protein
VPTEGHATDVLASFSLAGVSTATPVDLRLDVYQALLNNSHNSPGAVTLGVGVVGSNSPEVNTNLFPSDVSTLEPPGIPFGALVLPGNYSSPLLVEIDITRAIQTLESQGFSDADIYITTA